VAESRRAERNEEMTCGKNPAIIMLFYFRLIFVWCNIVLY
jgi:hypothetical protein